MQSASIENLQSAERAVDLAPFHPLSSVLAGVDTPWTSFAAMSVRPALIFIEAERRPPHLRTVARKRCHKGSNVIIR